MGNVALVIQSHCGASEPASMPTSAASTPASCCGKASESMALATNSSQVTNPAHGHRKIAPWVVARFQYRPNTRGTNAPTNGTW
jgi:hypothetical protein